LLYFFFPSGVRGIGFWGLAFRIGKTKLRGLCVWVMNFAKSRVAKSSFLDLFLRVLRGGFRWHSLSL
jgi:hypothetical protein